MKIKLHGGPGDGMVADLSIEVGTFAYLHELPDGSSESVLYFRHATHCGHADCPVAFVHPTLQGRIG